MIHRHLDYPPETPVTERGDAALDDLLDHADLAAWRELAAAVASDPHGELAERILKLCAANPRYGTSTLWRLWITRRRDLTRVPTVPPRSLAAIRQHRGLSQAALAAAIGMSQSDLSKTERRTDWKLSTLRQVAAGMGLSAHVVLADAEGHAVALLAPDEPGQQDERRESRTDTAP